MSSRQIIKLALIAAPAVLALLVVSLYYSVVRNNPHDVAAALKLKLRDVAQPSVILGRDEEPIGTFVEEARLATPIDSIPLHVQKAFLAAEDRNFYKHHGISAPGILRSALINLKRDRVAQGGSTITQQLVRQFLLTRDRTMTRKLREVDLAFRLEKQLTKKEILELWLNHVYLGNNAWGVGAASQHYFHKDVQDLNTGEAAILAGLPQAPSRYAPHLHPTASRIRKNYVLERMGAAGWLSREQVALWKNQKITVWRDRNLFHTSSPWVTEAVRVELWKKIEAQHLPRSGNKILTTIDSSWQLTAQNLVDKHFRSYANSGLEFAMATVDIPTGEIRTMIGGLDFKNSQFNRALNLARPMGESIYPLIFGWAADEGVTTISGYQTLGSAALLSSFHDADRAAVAMGYMALQKKLAQFDIKQPDIAAIDQSIGSPLRLAQIWRSLSGHPLLQNNLMSVSIETADGEKQWVRGKGLPVDSLSEESAYSLRAWLAASGFNGRVGEDIRVQSDSSWNHWEVAVGGDAVTAIWVGADQRAPKRPDSFQRIKTSATAFLDAWLVKSGCVSMPQQANPPPEGLSWQVIKRPNGQVARIPFPVLLR